MPSNTPAEVFKSAEAFNAGGISLSGQPGLTLPSVVISAFSLELYIKCLIILDGNNTGRTHNLKELFAKISLDSQNRIKTAYLAHQPTQEQDNMLLKQFGINIKANFDSALTLSSNAFEKFRYSFEGSKDSYGWNGNAITVCVRDEILRRNPNWVKLS